MSKVGTPRDIWKVITTLLGKFTIGGNIPSGDTFKWIAPFKCRILHVSFHNWGAGAYTSAASIENAGNSVVSSTATLASDAVEEKEGSDLDASYIDVADGAEVTIIAGDDTSYIVVTLTTLGDV